MKNTIAKFRLIFFTFWQNKNYFIKNILRKIQKLPIFGRELKENGNISGWGDGQDSDYSNQHENEDTRQSFFRIFIAILFAFYFLIIFANSNSVETNKANITESWVTIGIYILISFFYLIYINIKKGDHPKERYIMLVIDQLFYSCILYLTSGSAIIFFSVYICASLSSGMRFSKSYMLVSALSSIVGFICATWGTKYWLDNLDIGIGVILGLIVIPLQVLILQKKSEIVNAKLHLQAAELVLTATHDKLTGLPNRSLFCDRLSQGMARIQRDGGQLAVLFFDLDKFKNVNDTLGHNVGDKILISVAQKIQKHMRTSDTFSRHAGDEFIIIIHDVKWPNDSIRMADIVLKEVAGIKKIDGHNIDISSSIGIAIYPSEGMSNDPDVLIDRADQAMYQAKKEGRNRYCFDPLAKNNLPV